jgi:hypothetical protein
VPVLIDLVVKGFVKGGQIIVGIFAVVEGVVAGI